MVQSFGAEGAYTNNFIIDITHVATDKTVSFYAFLNSFNDKFKNNFKTQNVYGRMDPIINYQGTTRNISLSISIPAFSAEDAIENLGKIQDLIKFQYPTYNLATENSSGKTTTLNVSGMASPPICKMKFCNLINYNGEGLFGYFDGVDFNPVNEDTYFTDDSGNIYPKTIKLSLNFSALHSSPLGWDATTGTWIGEESGSPENQFPYNIVKEDKEEIAKQKGANFVLQSLGIAPPSLPSGVGALQKAAANSPAAAAAAASLGGE